jgi:hypothetical protein
MVQGVKKAERLLRTTITLPVSTARRLEELMMLMQISRSEILSYLIDREAERRISDVVRLRTQRNNKFQLNEDA